MLSSFFLFEMYVYLSAVAAAVAAIRENKNWGMRIEDTLDGWMRMKKKSVIIMPDVK